MRILFISGYFPPKAPMGAVRSGKLAEYWRDSGCDVRVIAIALPQQEWAHEQDSGVAAYYVRYSEPGQIVTSLTTAIRQSRLGQFVPSADNRRPDNAQQSWAIGNPKLEKPGLAELYRHILFLPDKYRSWIRPAVECAQSWTGNWRPDIIYSSGPPNSGHVAAKQLASRFGVPWIAEIRDLWLDNPNDHRHWIVAPFFDGQARRTLGRASGLVAVTDSDRKQLAARFRAPVVLSYNGYDPAEFRDLDEAEPLDREHLTILYAGAIYSGRRDPTPLFKAISLLGTQADRVRCVFCVDQAKTIEAMAETCAVRRNVEIRGVLRRSQVLMLEKQADILLECHWQDPAGDGVIPGKIFEYIGAARPILSLGSVTAEPARIVRENALGLASNDPEEIKAVLLEWLATKRQAGRIADVRSSGDERFQRQYQFRKIDDLMRAVGAGLERATTA
jgi:hypothetical protein